MSRLAKLIKHRLFQHTFFYTAAEVINKSVPFFMLPIFTRYLKPEDYGIIASFTTFEAILETFVGMSANGAISIQFFKLSKERLRVYIANSMFVLIASFLLFTGVVAVFHEVILTRLLIPVQWALAAVLLALMNYITLINMTLWRCEQKPKPFGIYQIAKTIVNMGVSAFFIIHLDMGWQGRLLGVSSAYLIFAVISTVFIVRRGYFEFRINKTDIKDMLSFGIPYIPHALSGWAKTGVDRVILISLLGAGATGIYSVGYQFGQIIGIFALAFNRAWTPHLYETLSNNNTWAQKRKLVKFTYVYFAGMLACGLLIGIFAPAFMRYVLDKKFNDSGAVVFWIALSYSFNGMYYMAVNYILYEKKTKILASITFSITLVHALLVYVLVKLNGAVGAAQASTISFFFHFVAIWYASAKIYPMPWRLRRHDC